MKHKIENKYLYASLTAFLVIGASLLLYFFFLRLDNIFSIFAKIIHILKPLIYGIIIAFILTQIYNYVENKLSKLLIKKMNDKELAKKYSKVISITISILVLFLAIFLTLYILIPKLMVSVLGIIESWSYNVDNIEVWLRNLLKESPALEKIILDAVNESSTSILSWISDALLPQMEAIMSSVTTGLNDMYTFITDFIIGLVFSIYILANKTKFIADLKKATYTILGIKKGNSVLQGARYSYKVFNGFIKGKLITSALIGTACYIGMTILRLPHTLLISMIVAITNVIPFFGPFIGWIPSVILIAMLSPLDAVYFSILILILQQIEGNILEPKIVGNQTGISGFWVLFSIVVFGELFGFIGMIFGVPVFAIIYKFVSHNVDKYLVSKRLPIDEEDYIDLKYIDETTRRPVKVKNSN